MVYRTLSSHPFERLRRPASVCKRVSVLHTCTLYSFNHYIISCWSEQTLARGHIHRMAACSMHNTLYIYYKFTWTRTQADAKSVFSGRALRLHVTIETSFGCPSSWAHKSESWPIHVEGDASSSSSKISIRLISDVGTSPALCGRALGSGSPRRRRHHVRHCGGGGRSHASAGRPMTLF